MDEIKNYLEQNGQLDGLLEPVACSQFNLKQLKRAYRHPFTYINPRLYTLTDDDIHNKPTQQKNPTTSGGGATMLTRVSEFSEESDSGVMDW